jgi:hypothetical protein
MIDMSAAILTKVDAQFARRGRSLHRLIGYGSLAALLIGPLFGCALIVVVTQGHQRISSKPAAAATTTQTMTDQTTTTTPTTTLVMPTTIPADEPGPGLDTYETTTTSVFEPITDPDDLSVEPYDPNRLPVLDPNS